MKKIFSILIAALLVFSLLPQQQTSAVTFSDVPPNHTYYQEIMFLLDKGVISPSEKYGINDKVTREEVAVMVSKAVGLDGTQTTTKFPDVPKSHRSSGYINSAVEAGIINGYLDGTFKPNEKVTRGHMAAFIAHGFKLTQEANVTFKDVPKGSTAYEPVRKLAYKGITTGYEDGTFKPTENLSRAHISAFIARAMGFKKDASNNVAKEMKVHFLDVGQGDSILIQSPAGENILIDGGTRGSGSKVVAFLREKDVKQLDYVVATHPDEDHVGGFITVLNSFPVDNFVNSGKVHTTQTYAELLMLVDSKNINYIEPKKAEIMIGDWTSDFYLQVLYVDPAAPDSNDASILIKTGYKEVDFLLMGDASTEIENYLIRTYDDISADVLKAGHHGSNTSSSANFISVVNPSATILSYGKDNSYGHPHSDVVSRLKAVNSKIYSTAESGDITVTTNGSTHSVSAKPWTGHGTPKTPAPTPKPEPSPSESFKNCTELRKVYPDGVQIGHPAYEKKHDRDGDGYACESETPSAPAPTPKPEPEPEPEQTNFKNCTELRKVYPGGVGRDHPAYQSKMDRDKDGWACE